VSRGENGDSSREGRKGGGRKGSYFWIGGRLRPQGNGGDPGELRRLALRGEKKKEGNRSRGGKRKGTETPPKISGGEEEGNTRASLN